MRHLGYLAPALFLAPIAGLADGAAVCVENGTDATLIFVAQSDDGDRRVARLEPSGKLCSGGADPGTVAVFARADDIEGCSRRVPAGATERLLAFPGVDLCSWERH
ncbi:MAG: hypothetical protein KJN93_07765 [Alphaproteobacteria bacterium]|nr:hypothetical protein [Alphaproteobacteria bacterium]NNF25321.1 hypothetical protein [Paracoccaceae bacterium]